MAGTRGRRPKPTALKVIEGNPGKRPLPKEEPRPEVSAPVMPPWLSADGKKAWKDLAPELERLGVLTKLDGISFATLCEVFARYRKCRGVIQRKGYTYTTKSGFERPRPEVSIMERAEKELRALSTEFGLTPSSRTRLAAGYAGGQMPLFGKSGEDPDKANAGTGNDDARKIFGF